MAPGVACLALILAIFRVPIASWMSPFDVKLVPFPKPLYEETPKEYVVHLRVVNQNHMRPIHKCSVLLTGITRAKIDEEFRREDEEFPPVERILQWAPFEFKEREATVWDRRTVDFGRLIQSGGTLSNMSAQQICVTHPDGDIPLLIEQHLKDYYDTLAKKHGVIEPVPHGCFYLIFYRPAEERPGEERQGGYLLHWIKPGEKSRYRLEIRGEGFKPRVDYLVEVSFGLPPSVDAKALADNFHIHLKEEPHRAFVS